MTHLLLVTGSLRRDSFNTRLLRHLAERLDPSLSIDLLDGRAVNLPLFDQDHEADAVIREHLHALHARFLACDGLIVSTPEYNGQPSAYLKNLIDWVSRVPYIDSTFENPFRDKPVLLCSASTGWSGGAVAIPSARALFGYVGALVLGETVCVPHVDQMWTGQSFELDPYVDLQVDEALVHIARLSQQFAQRRSA